MFLGTILLNLLFSTAWAQDPLLSHAYIKQFENCSVDKKMLYLSKEQKQQLSAQINIQNPSGVYKVYDFTCAQKAVTKVYLLSDLVRTHYQKAFVAIKDGKVSSFEIVYFAEPEKYKASQKFMALFTGKSSFKKIDAVTGATLTRSSLVRLAKLALELDQI